MTQHLPDGTPVEHLVPYPFWIMTNTDRLRFDLCVVIACEVMDARPDSAEVWAASRALFRSDLPT